MDAHESQLDILETKFKRMNLSQDVSLSDALKSFTSFSEPTCPVSSLANWLSFDQEFGHDYSSVSYFLNYYLDETNDDEVFFVTNGLSKILE